MNKQNKKIKQSILTNDIKLDYISDKIEIDSEGYINAIKDITEWEILMKGEWLYEEYWTLQSTSYTLIWEPYKKWNIRFIDKNTIQARKYIKVWDYISFSDNERDKPILFRAPNKFVYELSMAIIWLLLAIIITGIIYIIFYLWV